MKTNLVSQIQVQPQIDLSKTEEFVSKFVMPRAAKFDQIGEFDFELTQEMHKHGLLSVITPKEFGGPDLPVSDLIWIARKLSYGSGGTCATFIGNLLGYSAFVLYAQPQIKEKVIKRFTSQYGLWSFGMTEKGCGSDLMKTATTAIKTERGYILNGEKNYITNGSYSTDLSIFAQTKDQNGKELGISCFYIPGNSEGVTRGPGEKKMGWRESNTGHIMFKNVEVPHEHLLGQEGQGLRILTHCLNRSKTLLGAVGVGLCDRAFDLTIGRLTETERFDKPLIEKHAIKHELAKMTTKAECAWLLTCQAAATWDQKIYAVKESSMAKYYSGQIATEVCGKCIELFGARGFLADFEINRLYRDAKAIEIVEGPTLVQELLISKFTVDAVSEKFKKDKTEKRNQYDPNVKHDKAA